MKTRLQQQINKQKANNLWRNVNSNTYKNSHDFSRNDYLGFSSNQQVMQAFIDASHNYGISGAAAQTIGGFTQAHALLCAKLTSITNTEAACLFSSGFMANIALMTTLANKDNIIYLDRQSHASLISGAKLSQAKILRYQNCAPQSLAQKINQQRPGLIVTESIFSMSGKIAPIPEFIKLAQATNSEIIIDDAHGFGVLGLGLGAHKHFAIKKNEVTATTITFGKALGSAGAAIVGPKLIIDAIQQFAPSFLFTTALPANYAAATCKALEILETEPEHQQRLLENIATFTKHAQAYELKFNQNPNCPIQYLSGISIEKAKLIQAKLSTQGFNVQVIRPPTVAKNNIGIRIIITATQSSDIIKQLVESFHAAYSTY